MQYKDFYKHVICESTESFEFIQTDLNNGFKVGFVKKGDVNDRIRSSNMRVAYKNKIHKWLIEVDNQLFKKMKFNPIEVELIFSVVNSDDNEYGKTQGYVRMGDNKIYIGYDLLSGKNNTIDVVELIIHEWSHIWNYEKYDLVDDLIEQKYEMVKKTNSSKVSSYGLTNHYEFWSFLVERYDKLDDDLKQFVDTVIQKGK